MRAVRDAVSRESYPGRGIIVGMSGDGRSAILAYFIMGRSENSRNRVFVQDGDGIRTQAHDPSKVSDPSLIIYAPVRVLGCDTIVTNGDQTDTIYAHIKASGSFESALRTRQFEPDAPNYTPRISAIVSRRGEGFAYTMNILKSAGGNPAACDRFFFEYDHPLPGVGHFLHTYACDGEPLPSFAGEPEPVCLEGGIDRIADDLWEGLDAQNKVSLFVRFLSLADGKAEDRIINKLG